MTMMLPSAPKNIFIVFFGSVLLLWPALYNGQPFFFSDTSAYIRGADAGFQKLFGIETNWSRSDDDSSEVASIARPISSMGIEQPEPQKKSKVEVSLSSVKDKAVLAGRSIYYGVLLYLGNSAGFWPTVFIQSLLIVSALLFTLRYISKDAGIYLGLLLIVASLTPLPFFVSFLMPDVFAGFTILACAVLVAYERLRAKELTFWFGLLLFSLLAHSSHILLAGIMLFLGVAIILMKGYFRRYGILLISIALLAAIMGEAIFNYGVTNLVGAPPIRPPFLMARVINDGTGHEYLRATCPNNGFVVCRFVDRLPLTADEFLWNKDPGQGVFAISAPETRRALSSEQLRFLFAVIAYDPWAQVQASSINVFRQLSLIGISEFDYGELGDTYEGRIPAEHWATMQQSAAYTGKIPVGLISTLSWLSAIVGLSYVLWALIVSKMGNSRPGMLSLRVASLVLFGIFANAIVCGVMSTPHDRYQARVIWLLPIVAMIVDFERRQDWWRRKLWMPESEASPRITAPDT